MDCNRASATSSPLRIAAIAVFCLVCSGSAACGCSVGDVPELSPQQLESAVICEPPLTPKTEVDLTQPGLRDKLLAAYQGLTPWRQERGKVLPDLELLLQLADGRTIGVACQKGDPELLVRVYEGGELRSEIHAAGSLMYDLLLPDFPLPRE